MKGRPNALPYRKGVGAVLINRHGLVFVGRRIDAAVDAWQLPQGGVDDGEAPRRAVLRELKEEIGTDNAEIVAVSARWLAYDLPEELRARVWGGRYRGQKQRWYALRFLGDDSEIAPLDTPHPEFDAWRWTSMAALPDLAISFKRPLYAAIVEEFAPIATRIADEAASERVGDGPEAWGG